MNQKDSGKKSRNQQKEGACGQPPKANQSSRPSDLPTENTLNDREASVLADEKAVLEREDAALGREEETSLREKVVDLREETADKREKILRTHKKGAKIKDDFRAQKYDQMREANENLLVAAVNAMTMKEAAEQISAQMSHMAERDGLTGLPNRALLSDRLAQSILFARRHNKKLALMFLDLDHFKRINDSFGHKIGDQLLQSVAKRLQAGIRHSDTVSRHGGDEFVILLAEIEEVQDAAVIAEKLVKAMEEPHLIDGHKINITFSIGISIYPDDARDIETLFRNADAAMYYAKKIGRNRYGMFSSDMNDRAVARQSVEKTLLQAIEQRRFVLHYLPKMDLETGAITGVEALIRLRQSGNQLVPPTDFVSIAEECGLILPIGRWVLGEACRQAQDWLQAGLDVGQISVNVTARELHSKDFIKDVHAILDSIGLAPHYLQLELTENALVQHADQTIVILKALKEMGIKIAIDDFGTGYTSLNFLLRLPIDTIKIDGSLIQKINGHGEETIIAAAIAIGKSLRQGVVAEGIESQHQLAYLKDNKCAEGQGYYLGRPMAADKFASLLAGDR
jgi:diguanylate cyclase